ncbi:MAG: nucleotidyltransferase domain-containing protein [Prevotella sp.]|jgi:predicted nucleotidyltransferase|nr:nucleotidyltransferase domain-containing protein [Prevotella sp.]
MDRESPLSFNEALNIVKAYKQVIKARYRNEPKVFMYGSYAKGNANRDSDIDVAVIVAEGEIVNKWEQWADLWEDIRKVSVLIEPVLLEEKEDSMLYREIMRSGIAA